MNPLTRYTLRDLQNFTFSDLERLWEQVPTDRQRHYVDRLSGEVHAQGAQGSDQAELVILEALLERYLADRLVPVGARWVKVPPRIWQAADEGASLHAPENTVVPVGRLASPLIVLVGGLLLFGCFFGVFLLRNSGGSEEANTTPSALAIGSPTPRRTATATPIALVESDEVIRDGDTDRALAYPISLQILPPTSDQPRVFIVQRRRVDLAEWQYDPNPDTASFLSDLPVRRVIGIPYSRENAALFASLSAGTEFSLHLNTGGKLRFAFASQQTVPRSETRFFRQSEPGLTLVLIGETGTDGLPTGQRWIVMATYLAEQELTRAGLLSASAGLPTPQATLAMIQTPSPTPDPRQQLVVSLMGTGVTTQAATQSLTVRLRVYNDQAVAVDLFAEDFRLALGYSPRPLGPWLTASTLEPFTLLPGQAVDLTLVWPWNGEPYGLLAALAFRFACTLTPA